MSYNNILECTMLVHLVALLGCRILNPPQVPQQDINQIPRGDWDRPPRAAPGCIMPGNFAPMSGPRCAFEGGERETTGAALLATNRTRFKKEKEEEGKGTNPPAARGNTAASLRRTPPQPDTHPPGAFGGETRSSRERESVSRCICHGGRKGGRSSRSLSPSRTRPRWSAKDNNGLRLRRGLAWGGEGLEPGPHFSVCPLSTVPGGREGERRERGGER